LGEISAGIFEKNMENKLIQEQYEYGFSQKQTIILQNKRRV